MDMKKCEKTMREMAGNPSEDRLKELRVMGIPAIKMSKKVLLYALASLVNDRREKAAEFKRRFEFITSL